MVGDLEGNVARLMEAYDRAEAAGADLVAFPELAITGYPPEDLLLRPAFVEQATEWLEKVAVRTGRTVGDRRLSPVGGLSTTPRPSAPTATSPGCTASICFPTTRCSTSSGISPPRTADGPLFEIGGTRVGVTICEDAWSPTGPVLTEAAAGAELIVNINASPYYAGRLREREAMLATRAAAAAAPILYVNLVGGQDELVFDGASLVVDETGAVVARARQFEEDLLVSTSSSVPCRSAPSVARGDGPSRPSRRSP